MTHKQREVRYRWFRRIGWIGLFALGFQTAAPAAEAGVQIATRHYRTWQRQRAQQPPSPPDVRVLRKSEMLALKGRGRIPSLAGQAKWDIIDNGVNLRTRNYTYTTTDLTLPGAIGIPVSVVRTWNANDDREGPFGIGWSWSLDVRQAAGGLIKRKASPSRTVPTQLNNARKAIVTQFIAGSSGISIQSVQVDGIVSQDLSGEQWIAWRDADGLYTPPPWDHNEYESTYQSVLMGTGENQYWRDYAETTKVTTPDGTVYFYEAVRQRNGLPVVLDENGNEVYAEQVLKWVEDRHGNRTEYTYVFADQVRHRYYLPNGQQAEAVVRKAFVRSVRNASGFELTVEWNFNRGEGYENGVLVHPRVVSISSSDGRTVRYGYGPEGQELNGPQNWAGSVTAVQSPGGIVVARYRYGSWSCGSCEWLPPAFSRYETELLTSIIDADDATTQIVYNTGSTYSDDTLFYAVAVRSIILPSGQQMDYEGGLNITKVRLQEALGVPCEDNTMVYRSTRVIQFYGGNNETIEVIDGAYSRLTWTPHRFRLYNKLDQTLSQEKWIKSVFCEYIPAPCEECSIAYDHRGTVADIEYAMHALQQSIRDIPVQNLMEIPCLGSEEFLITSYGYNCLGQPVRIMTTSYSYLNNQGSFSQQQDFLHERTIEYHGKDYYYQKWRETEVVRGQTRTTFYSYFPRSAPQGYRGQLSAVQYAVSGTPSFNTVLSEVLEYNQFGQPTLTRALQRTDNPQRWIYTKTEYDPIFHQPNKVIEDYRYPNDPVARQSGIHRIQTTQYDPQGRPQYQATYAPNPNNPEQPGTLVRRLETVYDPATEQVKEVWRVDANGTHLQKLASYTYTNAGRLRTATDHLSNITTEIEYYATGQVSEMREKWSNQLRYKMNYYYAIANSGGDLKRKELRIYPDTPQQQVYQWDYGYYLTSLTFPLQRVFTRVVMRSLTYPMPPQVVDYLYDPQTMRLRAARFAVQPIGDTQDPDYDRGKSEALGIGSSADEIGLPLSQQSPQSFAFAWYAYDGAGRLTELRYYQASLRDPNQRTREKYDYVPRGGFFYLTDSGAPAYDEAGNRFRMNAIDEWGNLVRTETYQYDALDRLIGVSYNGGAWQTWSYDVMGNRYGAGNPAYDGLNRLTQFNGAAITHDLLGNRLQDGRYLYQWDPLNRFVQMGAYQRSGRSVVIGDTWRFGYRADGLRVLKEKLSPVVALGGDEGAGGSIRTEYLYDGQMPVCEQEFAGSTLRTTRVNFLGARGIEAVIVIDHTRGNQVALRWLLYDGHGNLVRTLSPDYTMSAFQWRGVWGEVQGSLGVGRGYCANLGHPEDETGLVYMRARYYEPATGRFISEDPEGYGENWYLYADGNPVSKFDPDGRAVYIDFNGYWIRLDHPYHQEGTGRDIQDLTWGTWEGGQRVQQGSIRPDGSVKHGKPMPKKLIKLINGDPNTLKKLIKRGGYGLTATVLLCSLDAAFLSDPRGFSDIVDIIGGEWDLFGGAVRVSKAYD